MRRAHAKHRSFCSCGKIVSGNGARASHKSMHARESDGHRYLIEDEWRKRFVTFTHPPDAPAEGDER
jgi:hypothetical protein